MPYISNEEIEKLIEVERYLGEKENWSENTTKIWGVIESLLQKLQKDREKSRAKMAHLRATNPKYDRKKKNND